MIKVEVLSVDELLEQLGMAEEVSIRPQATVAMPWELRLAVARIKVDAVELLEKRCGNFEYSYEVVDASSLQLGEWTHRLRSGLAQQPDGDSAIFTNDVLDKHGLVVVMHGELVSTGVSQGSVCER